MDYLYGEHFCKVDTKGRVMFPSPFRKAIQAIEEEGLMIIKGFDKGLIIHRMGEWKEIEKKLAALNYYDKNDRALIRFMTRSATHIKLDSVGRFLLPKNLLEYAAVEKECVFCALLNKIELFSIQEYNMRKEMESDSSRSADLAQKVFGNNINADK